MVRFYSTSALLAVCCCCHGLDPYTSDRRNDPPSDAAFTATAHGAPLDAHRRDMFNLAFGPESTSQGMCYIRANSMSRRRIYVDNMKYSTHARPTPPVVEFVSCVCVPRRTILMYHHSHHY